MPDERPVEHETFVFAPGMSSKASFLEALNLADLTQAWAATHTTTRQIAKIETLAESVFENKAVAHEWLLRPNRATDNKRPLDLLGDSRGFERVENLLLRIEYGVLT